MTISTPELLSNFSAYLTGQQLSSVTAKNYLSDIRYFFDWFRTAYPDLLPLPLDQQITPQTLNFFHQHLSGNLPLKTANRRLSSVRKFCQYLVEQNYTAENSANHLPNITSLPPAQSVSPDEVKPPSYHLLHEIPNFSDNRHPNVPILQDIIPESIPASTTTNETANRHPDTPYSTPAPSSPVELPIKTSLETETSPQKKFSPSRLLLYIVPIVVFVLSLLVITFLTPTPQLINPTP